MGEPIAGRVNTGVTRRRLGAISLTAAALGAARGRGALAGVAELPGGVGFPHSPDISSGPFDVAIIGAGIAGIAAARVCQGKANYVVIEARNRIGGRAWSRNQFVTPVDLGAQWFQFVTPNESGTGTNNPLFDIAVELSLKSERVRALLDLKPDLFGREYYRDGHQVPIFEPDALAVTLLLVEMQAVVDAAGKLISQGVLPDMSAAEAVFEAGLSNQKWSRFATNLLTGPHGAAADRLSVLDLYNLDRFGPEPQTPNPFNWLTRYGMGNFITDFVARNLPVSLNTVATGVNWGDAGGVRIATTAGTIQAKTVIVTVPVSVLAQHLSAFSPLLPPEYQDAIGALPPGAVEKVGMQFDRNVFADLVGKDSENTLATLLVDAPDARFVQARLWDTTIGVCLVDGAAAQELAKQGEQALIAYGVETVQKIFGGDPASRLVRAAASTWWTDPWSLGAYSYASAGDVPQRAILARPLANQVFFAGEAATVDRHSSLPGAWLSGKAAAESAVAAVAAAQTSSRSFG